MLDRKFLRENRDLVTAAVAAKRDAVDVDAYYRADGERRACLQEYEELQAEANRANKAIAAGRKSGADTGADIARMKEISARLKDLKQQADAAEAAAETLYLRLPNVPHASVRTGGEEDNTVVRAWGEVVEPAFAAKPHWDLGAALGIMDLEAAARMSGSGFTLLTGQGARLERALINFMIDVHLEQGYVEVNAPYLVNREAMTGTGQLPKMEEDMYACPLDGLYLIPTAEVSVTNMHRQSTLDWERLPLKYVAFSPCFRREAGAAGKDTRGLLRVHQFHKVEMVQFVRPGTSYETLETLTDDAEEILRRLGLPYRVVALASGDLSFAAAKCYDLEAWAAGVGKWLEVSSCSNFEDFQARRAGIRVKGPDGAVFVHTLNGSGLALPRVLVAILENYQTPDGRVRVPEVLRPYMGGLEHIG
ncbi:MAG: serine--tRNA ligase [bacterium]|nr:serine--tRNA ligase [bacterium]